MCLSGEDSHIFVFHAERTQRLFLKDVLGDDDTNTALVKAIIESIKKCTEEQLRVIDKMRLFMWVSSSVMDERSFNVVVHHLLVGGADAVENKHINQVMFENVCSSTSPTQANPPTSRPSFLVPAVANTLFKEKIPHFGDKEVCGIPLLGIFVVEVAQQFSILEGVDFKADMEFPVVVNKLKPGQKTACDGAVCVVVSFALTGLTKPLVLAI